MREVIKLGNHCLRKLLKNFCLSKHMEIFSSTSSASGITAESDNSSNHGERLKIIQKIIPKLTSNLHKGQCGRVGVIGGSFEYTGAPYFTAISSMKMGSDLAYVFCCQAAGPVIKSYSPDLIVHPFLDSEDVVKKIEPLLERLHALVIGPGMGRDKGVLINVAKIINHCKNNMKPPIPLIIDADGLYLITEDIDLIKNYKGLLILTPNVVEFNRLSVKMVENDPLKIAESLNAILFQKGHVDIIANGIQNKSFNLSCDERIIMCDVPGSNRRCGGQGDILSGCLATVVAWLQLYLRYNFDFNFYCDSAEKKDENSYKDIFVLHSMVVYGASVMARTSSRLAFESKGRGMTASDMIPYINKAFKLNFGKRVLTHEESREFEAVISREVRDVEGQRNTIWNLKESFIYNEHRLKEYKDSFDFKFCPFSI